MSDGTRQLVLTTAAAEKVYRTLAPETTVDVTLTVAEGGELAWLPQETILFDQARLHAHDRGRSRRRCAPAAGRGGRIRPLRHGRSGRERAAFDRWRVRRDGRLIYAETMRLDGPVSHKLANPAVANGGVAIATLVLAPGDDAVVAAVRALGDRFRGEVGASAWNGLAVVRLVARDGAALRHDLIAVLSALRGRALPRLWLN